VESKMTTGENGSEKDQVRKVRWVSSFRFRAVIGDVRCWYRGLEWDIVKAGC
jgi:hypothetical protein